MPSPNTAVDIAAWFLGKIDREAGDLITHLKLQKLVYYAQAWSLALRDQPLFDEDLQAWAHGPVAESIYQKWKGCGWDALPPADFEPEIADDVREHLSTILASYGDMSAKHLEAMTHAEAPWLTARGNLAPELRSTTPITKSSMSEYYKTLYQEG